MAIPTPVAFWNLNESSGNAVDAVVGGGQNEFVNNNTVGYVSGLIGNAADFTATNKYFSIADGTQVGLEPSSGSYSFGGWFYVDADIGANTGYRYFEKFGAGGNRSYTLNRDRFTYSGSSNHLTLSVISAAGVSFDIDVSNWSPALGSWQHIIGVADHTNDLLIAYVDNVNVKQMAFTGTGTFNSTAPVTIGSNGESPDGKADMVGFWNVALTSGQVSELYNSGAGIQYPFVSGPANLKSYNTNVLANIKSIDTNLIANVKSFDTNV